MTSLKSLNILLADDNAQMSTIVASMLQATGIRKIYQAADGASALNLVRDHPIDLAIVDFNMAPVDGVSFTRQVRNDPRSPNPYLPIIMMTGHSALRLVTEARDAGINEFLAKPLTARSLMDRIQALILRPRVYVRATTYFGPDRRRLAQTSYSGPQRRLSAPVAAFDLET